VVHRADGRHHQDFDQGEIKVKTMRLRLIAVSFTRASSPFSLP